MRTNCPLCGGPRLDIALRRERAPVSQNALYRSENAALSAKMGTIELAACGDCGFVFNRAFDPDLVVYDAEYENDQSHGDVFPAHMDAMADRVLAALPRDGGTIVEIGCGQGVFLERLARRANGRNVVLRGMDPSFRGHVGNPNVRILPCKLTEAAFTELGLKPDVLVLRHVIEHIDNPVEFVSLIRRSVKDNPGARFFVETPSFEWIAENVVLQDIFYEHVNYFSRATLSAALAKSGFVPQSVNYVFDGQHLWADSIIANTRPGAVPNTDPALSSEAQTYGRNVDAQIAHWRATADGVPTALWGAGAKGVTFALLIDPERTYLDCLIDINPKKQGGFVPGTGHPVVSPAEAARRGVRRVIIMNPNYSSEIRAGLKTQGWDPEVLEGGVAVL